MHVHSHHDHGSSSHHGHSHGHGHDHLVPDSFGRAFAWATALNLGFVVAEVAAGLWGNSMALLADAGHNLSDVLGLVMAWGAHYLGRVRASRRYTYGYQSSSILAALGNAVLLLLACGAIAWEAVRRLLDPEPVLGGLMMAVAGLGMLVNFGTALLFVKGRKGDLNIRGAYLHMLADGLVSAGVVVAGFLVIMTQADWLDPLTSLIVVALIAVGTWGLFRDSLRLALAGVPPTIDLPEVERSLGDLPGVTAVHHLHIWPISTTANAMTAHLVMPDGHPGDRFLVEVAETLEDRFGISHATLQVEQGDACPDDAIGCR